MIQELLGGGAGLLGGERKISIPPSPSPSPSPSSSTTTTPTTSAASENPNLRCPRCDSSNTKFCYYNNYNLTQPRHFCKTCRRYWTKGGALRNVPIGGGCRKNKPTTITSSVGKANTSGKLKTVPSEIAKSGFINGLDHDLPSNPILWASPQSSHILALLRASQNPNPISNTSTMTSEPLARTLGFEPLSHQVPSIWRNNQFQLQQQQQQQNGFIFSEVQNNGIPDMYQRFRSSSGNYYPHDHSSVILGNMAASSSSAILESAPVGGAELGYWNPALSWSDLPTTNGAFP